MLIWDPDHPQLNGGSGTDLSPGKAAVSVYGRGFGNASNGLVMYQASHDFAKRLRHGERRRAADLPQLQPARRHRPLAGGNGHGQSDADHRGDTIPVSATAPGGSGPYTYKWTSSCGGSFANSTAASTTFTAPTLASITPAPSG